MALRRPSPDNREVTCTLGRILSCLDLRRQPVGGQVIPGALQLPAGMEGETRPPPYPRLPWFRRGCSSFSVTPRLTFRTSPPAGGTGWPSAPSFTSTGEGALEKTWLEGCCPGATLSSRGLGEQVASPAGAVSWPAAKYRGFLMDFGPG